MKLKLGDKVKIIQGPPDKLGKIGVVAMVLSNGAGVKLSPNRYTVVKFIHLEKIKEK